MLPKPALLSSIEVPEPALSLSSAGLALLRVLAVSMYLLALYRTMALLNRHYIGPPTVL